ncbi:phospholipase D-like domain-containing protein [Staphylococcus pseudintermedius]|uniref:phospholipase D-like domain-containing protein n=1 Tax=Staphylococcus pseudintermedius TaxID=283734 RepID=UPI001BDF4A41|nr:phospholipase D-like domain-containing protein [Staphylococcus pseudintermedius]
MEKQVVIENGKFIFSKDENSFKEVLDRFRFANEIIIITYNLSKNDDSLIQSLKKLNQKQHVKLFTNIPGRFESYFNDNNKKRAKDIIDNYIKKLKPSSFECNIEVYFSFSNHSKIITADSVAYIGSANFSSESKMNFEAGVLFNDSNFINYLKQEVVPELIKNSYEYYLEEEVKEIGLVYNYLKSIKRISEELSELFYKPIEVHDRIIGKSFGLNFAHNTSNITNDLQYNLCEIDQFLNSFRIDFEIIEEYYTEIDTILSDINIDDIIKLIDEDSLLYKFVNGNEERIIQDIIQSEMEDYGEINSDTLNNQAHELLDEFLFAQEKNVKEKLLMFENQISQLYNDMNKILDLLPNYMKSKRKVNPNIDNT